MAAILCDPAYHFIKATSKELVALLGDSSGFRRDRGQQIMVDLGEDAPIVRPGLKDTLDDKAIAGVLTYVGNSWGNRAGTISAASVKKIRDETAARVQPFKAEELR